jgi:hypothetical protein
MKIATFGSKVISGQIASLEKASVSLGHEINQVNPDIIYVNNAEGKDLRDAIELKRKTGAFLINNILEIPPHLLIDGYDTSRYPKVELPNSPWWKRDFDPQVAYKGLGEHSDVITCICHEAQRQIKDWLNLDSEVIFCPMRPILDLGLDRDINFSYVGRANDPNRRFDIVVKTVLIYSGDQNIIVAGTENPQFGQYLGPITDHSLNILYNRTKFFLLPSAFKSVGLCAIEAVVGGAIPIVASDDPSSVEFWEQIMLPPDPSEIVAKLKDEKWVNMAQEWVRSKQLLYSHKFHPISVAQNILNLYK